MRLVLLLLAGTLLCACSSGRSFSYGSKRAKIGQQPGAPVYAYQPTAADVDSIGILACCDTVQVLAEDYSRSGWDGSESYACLILFKGDTALLTSPHVMPLWWYQDASFELPSSADKDAWARANFYVGKHAGMKIQVATDFEVTTYNSMDGLRSFSIRRLPQGDRVKYEVTSNGSPTSDAAKKCAFYIVTGEEA